VGNENLGVVARLLAHDQDVDVQRARPPANLARTIRRRLGATSALEEFARLASVMISTTMFQKSSWATPPTGSVS
jgi:hypothetical protein